jgi:hypothetical protein
VGIHNDNHHYLSCNCLDSCKVEKHKDHLNNEREVSDKRRKKQLISYDLHTVVRYIPEDIGK